MPDAATSRSTVGADLDSFTPTLNNLSAFPRADAKIIFELDGKYYQWEESSIVLTERVLIRKRDSFLVECMSILPSKYPWFQRKVVSSTRGATTCIDDWDVCESSDPSQSTKAPRSNSSKSDQQEIEFGL